MKTAEKKKKILTDVKKFTIKRSKWGRGNENTASLLNTRNGKMCCLGFYALACGFKPEDIENLTGPDSLVSALRGDGVSTKYGRNVDLRKRNIKWETKLVLLEYGNASPSEVCSNLMSVNDDHDMKPNDPVRENRIADLFKKIGVQVEFKD